MPAPAKRLKTATRLKNLLFGKAKKKQPGKAPVGRPPGTRKKPPEKEVAAPAAKPGKGAPAKAGVVAPTRGRNSGSHEKVRASLKAALEGDKVQVDSSGEAICRESACESLATSGGYCRLHYVKNWKKVKRKELILKERKLNRYIEELVAKYPDKYIEAIRQDLANDKDFNKVVSDLELAETLDDFEGDQENIENIIDTIKRDTEEEDF